MTRLLLALSLATFPVAFGQTADQQNGVPSLKETLDWIKDKTPLASNHYVIELVWPINGSKTKDVSLRTVPIRFESCTVIYDLTEANIWEKIPNLPIVT